MARVKGPNGLTLDLPDGVAEDLVRSPSGDYSYVEDESKPKSTTKKSSSTKK